MGDVLHLRLWSKGKNQGWESPNRRHVQDIKSGVRRSFSYSGVCQFTPSLLIRAYPRHQRFFVGFVPAAGRAVHVNIRGFPPGSDPTTDCQSFAGT
jgi:hypothetical protein